MKKIIFTENAPAPIGPYNQAVLKGNTLYTSGQIAIHPATGVLVLDSIEAETQQVMQNMKAVLEAAGMTFENVVKTTIFIMNMGDFTKINSVYGKYFNDESFQRRHTCAGLLSMANKGKNTNSSSFIITLQQCVHLDGKNVVFGQVIQGMEIIREISKLPCDTQDRPKVNVTIFNCGDFDIRGISNRENVFLDALKS